MSKNIYISILFIASLFAFTGCETANVAVQDKSIEYSGPKVRVIVHNVGLAAKISPGEQENFDINVIKEQLATALTRTNVFTVAEDNNANYQNVQYLINIFITEYESNDVNVNKKLASGSKTAGSCSNIISTSLNTISSGLNSVVDTFNFKKNYIAMNIHLVDPITRDTVNSQRIEGNPKEFVCSRKEIAGNIKTPIQKAIWACIDKAGTWAARTAISNKKFSNGSSLSSNSSPENSRPAK
jgi:hypothetical protein